MMEKRKHMRGFTVMELVIVISILSIISAVAVPKYIALSQDAKVQKTINAVNKIGTTVMMQFHHLAGVSSIWPQLSNAGSITDITAGNVLFESTEYYGSVRWSDLFTDRQVPISPIDKQNYKIQVLSTGSVDYISTGAGTMMANVIDPEFKIMWISQDTPPDSISALFRP